MGLKRLFLATAIFVVGITPASAQLLSNATLNGAYYFRYLGALTEPRDSPRSFQGTVTFDGNGTYTITGQGASPVTGGLKPLSTGDYYVASNGIFYMKNPVDNP